MLLVTRFIKGCFNKEFIKGWKNVNLLSVLKILKWNSEKNTSSLGQFRKKITVQGLHNPTKQPPKNVRIAVLKNFRKFSRVLFYFLLLRALHHAWFQNSCFKEHIRMAASEILCGNRRDGFLFHRSSRPETGIIRIAVQKKFEKTPRKKSVLVCFF